MSIVTKESNPELYNSLFEDATIEDAKKVMQNIFNDITPEQFEEYKKELTNNTYCVICKEKINGDSQFVKGKWYHNDCIENLNNIINRIQKELKILKHRLNYEEDYYIEEYDIDKVLNISESKGDE